MNNPLSSHDTETVNRILAEELGVTQDQVKGDAHLFHDLGADSLSIVEIVMKLEDQFGLSLPDESLEHVKTITDLHETLADALQQIGHA